VRAHGVNRKLWKRHQLLAASHFHTASAADGEEEEEADSDDTAAAAAAASAAQCHSRLHTLLLAECSLLSARALSLLSTIPSLVRAPETRTERSLWRVVLAARSLTVVCRVASCCVSCRVTCCHD
jgi:hypothetical protein